MIFDENSVGRYKLSRLLVVNVDTFDIFPSNFNLSYTCISYISNISFFHIKLVSSRMINQQTNHRNNNIIQIYIREKLNSKF